MRAQPSARSSDDEADHRRLAHGLLLDLPYHPAFRLLHHHRTRVTVLLHAWLSVSRAGVTRPPAPQPRATPHTPRRAAHWSRNQVSNIPEIIPGASPRGPKRSVGVPGCANGSLFCDGKRSPFSPPSCRASPHCERKAFTREASRSRLEHSPRQRAASEGVVVPKEGCPTARRFLPPQVRAVQSLWQTVQTV